MGEGGMDFSGGGGLVGKEVLDGNCLLRGVKNARIEVMNCACAGRDGRGMSYDMTGDAALEMYT
jgi:hypothetical protein